MAERISLHNAHQVGVQMIGKRAGNKGACAISFNLNSTSICVISSHLAAGQKAVVKRNEDYTDITNGYVE